ncbi:DNA mismatch repair protein MutL [Keratinibaculum paraultunense]|uniref:DNA mismatch repair protein MutL n=1 Tax=Keratinibaculum paraultunense TaxID=1278232 RepID=A0A4R3KZX5_9FIRM|nr:DNA mismatch repair endonuclease MutL [Keratinibaculum paraultunense]QQY80664.1 DNA mismatch repair endonuclease MutL [Keratinibaculum paraultunense]TCS91399.1 DNA mismatch repair protein MutL [Keratinibaculum paraultunense]
MKRIKILDEKTIQKIAAGEIIERPSSVVKELVENSLDANATNITIEIRQGGKSYIRITDDGDGILEEDLSIAFKRHSTSKLTNANDLYRIMSFGFRGEALASISTVSKVEVLTKTNKDKFGVQAFVEEGKIIDKKPVGCPKGTTMIVRDLFYNVPVREKFLKSDISEANHINDIVYKLALGNPGVSFKYIKDNKIIFQTSNNNDILTNIYTLLGEDFSKNLLEINYEDVDFRIYGYISNNTFYRSNRKHQYIYVNNRYVDNNHISNLIECKYKSIIPINRFPVFVIFIDIDPSFIDVNIHPNKQQIKFINQNKLDSKLEYIINSQLNKNLSIPKKEFHEKKQNDNTNEIPRLYREILLEEDKLEKDKEVINLDKKNKIAESEINYNNINKVYKENTITTKEKEEDLNDLKNVLNRLRPIGIIFSTYILAEDPLYDKLLIIDQHAAHERIIFEKYKNEYEKEMVAIQHLITPQILELTNTELEIVKKNIDLFNRLGFIVEEFGTNSVIIRGVPILFGKPQTKKLFLELVDTISNDIKSTYEVKLDKIIKIACTEAIKSGDRIENIEVDSLLQQLGNTSNPYTCPHGRPTIIQITKKDLEKEFKRIM